MHVTESRSCLSGCCCRLQLQHRLAFTYRCRLTTIRIDIFVRAVVGVRVSIEAATIFRIRGHRINAQKSARYRIIVPLLHVHKAGLGIIDMAGKADRRHCTRRRITIRLVPRSTDDPAVLISARDGTTQAIRMNVFNTPRKLWPLNRDHNVRRVLAKPLYHLVYHPPLEIGQSRRGRCRDRRCKVECANPARQYGTCQFNSRGSPRSVIQ